jgi:hypothetical protein
MTNAQRQRQQQPTRQQLNEARGAYYYDEGRRVQTFHELFLFPTMDDAGHTGTRACICGPTLIDEYDAHNGEVHVEVWKHHAGMC